MVNEAMDAMNTNKKTHLDKDDDHNGNYSNILLFFLKMFSWDEDGELTHESQFAGCGKQRKQQNEKTQENYF